MIQVSIRRKSFVNFSNWTDVLKALQAAYRERDDTDELSFTITSNGGWLRMKNIPDHVFDETFEDGEAIRLYFHAFSDTKGPGGCINV